MHGRLVTLLPSCRRQRNSGSLWGNGLPVETSWLRRLRCLCGRGQGACALAGVAMGTASPTSRLPSSPPGRPMKTAREARWKLSSVWTFQPHQPGLCGRGDTPAGRGLSRWAPSSATAVEQ